MSKSNIDSEEQINKEEAIPEEFVKVIYDLINDILFTFPEYKQSLNIDLHNIKETRDEESIRNVYEHIKTVYPERFFDILYKNEEMFSKSEINTEFLPGIEFKELWKEDISAKTKDTIWKYLQVILFSVIGKVNSEDSFGDTAKLFEAINQEDLKDKLEETMNNLQNMMGDESPIIDVSGIDHLPRPEDIQGHINGLLEGKLGKLAKEIAAETAEDLNIDAENANSVNDVFQNLMKDPTKLMGMVQNVGGKLDEKIKSGEIKESELMQEASDLLSKMKDMPGMGDIQSLMQKMGMGRGGSMPGGGKVNMNAMTNALNQNMRKAQVREKAIQQSAQKKAEREREQQRLASLPPVKPLTDAELEELVFSIEGEKPEKSSRQAKGTKGTTGTDGCGITGKNNTVSGNGENKKKKKKKPKK